MTHGRHDRGDERGPDRAGAAAPPTSTSARGPSSSRTSSASRTSSTPRCALAERRRRTRRDPRRRARCTCPPTGSGRTARDAVRVGVRPEKITLVAGRPATCPSGANVLRGTVVVAAFLGVSIQYVVRAAGGEELTVIAQNRRRRRAGRRSAPGREVQLAWDPQHTFVVAKETTHADDPARARARGVLRRRERSRGGGSSGAPARPASRCPGCRRCSPPAAAIEGTRRARPSKPKASTAVNHPKTAIGDWTFSNWPLYIDKKVLKDFDKKYGGKVKYVEEINDNYEFFGKVRQQLEQGKPIGRDIVVLTDYMAARWVRLGYVEPIDKKNIPNAGRTWSTTSQTINYDPERTFTLPWQSGAIGIGYNIKKTGRELKSVKDLFDPKFKGRVTMLSEPYDSANTVLLGDGVDASKANDRPDPRGDREDRQGQPGRPDPPLHRQRLHDRPRQGQRVGLAGLLRRPRPAAGRQPGPAVRLPRGGRDAVHRQHDDAGQGRAPVRGRDDDELRLRARGGGEDRAPTSTTSRRSRASRRSSRRPTRSSPRTR